MAKEYRVVDENGVPLDDDREEHETPQMWLERWRTFEGWPGAQLEERTTQVTTPWTVVTTTQTPRDRPDEAGPEDD